ncbi:MAG: GntR family transcriptional regulator, partial [Pseudomonadota bacterium]
MPAPTKDTCLDTLRTEILTLAIQPGSDLDEAALSDRFGLSRTPLREVLQRLAGEGYVTQTRNRGAKVASMDRGQPGHRGINHRSRLKERPHLAEVHRGNLRPPVPRLR